MDVTLGPWKTDKSVGEQGKALAEAMGEEAWKTVEKSTDFTPVKPPKDKPANMGFTILGTVASVVKKPGNVHVTARFNIWVDGSMSNVATFEGKGAAQGSSTAEDALRAITESRIKMALAAIKGGRVVKQG